MALQQQNKNNIKTQIPQLLTQTLPERLLRLYGTLTIGGLDQRYFWGQIHRINVCWLIIHLSVAEKNGCL